MKTLLFCTSYGERLDHWNERWHRWLTAVRDLDLGADEILIVDDGSPVLPDWPDCPIISVEHAAQFNHPVSIHHFSDRRGQRVGGEPFPGWYRSFSHAVSYGILQGFDRIIHIEADAFLISERIRNYFKTCSRGWVALWCQRHSFPESTLQIINKDQFDSCLAFSHSHTRRT